MRRNLDDLRHRRFDLIIVGGGISGACLAHDAALRGLSVALVERRDFASATSSASSKLLHGGIRYLQHFQLAKVRESALECAAFQCIAPHLTRYVPFLIPTYRGFARGWALLQAGLLAYDLLRVGQNRVIRDPSKRVPAPRHVSRDELAHLAPLVSDQGDITGAYLLPESHMYNSERMVLAFLKSAHRRGAALANYVGVEGFVTEGSRIAGIHARDALSGEGFRVQGRLVANAAGPWIMRLNETAHIRRLTRSITRFSKGVHVVVRCLSKDYALALPSEHRSQTMVDRGSRHVFVIPWRGRSLVGTTNAPFEGDLDQVAPTRDDIGGLIADVNRAARRARLTDADVTHAFAGLYPLTDEVIRPDVYQGTGTYQVVDHARTEGVEGLVSVLGAKYTTARRLAEQATDLIERKLGRPVTPCTTASTPLLPGQISDLTQFSAEANRRFGSFLEAETIGHLVASYGAECDAVVTTHRSDGREFTRLTPARESIEAEVIFAVRAEMALTLEDVIFRRTGLGTIGHPGRAVLERCAELVGSELNWSGEEQERQLRAVEARFVHL